MKSAKTSLKLNATSLRLTTAMIWMLEVAEVMVINDEECQMVKEEVCETHE